ncbi:hypothetical protein DT019_38465 [Streptomyces sp. SDr-06]|nr:hypothetical protein DT019_38465 [Streptomyces sp. SDr-06]
MLVLEDEFAGEPGGVDEGAGPRPVGAGRQQQILFRVWMQRAAPRASERVSAGSIRTVSR